MIAGVETAPRQPEPADKPLFASAMTRAAHAPMLLQLPEPHARSIDDCLVGLNARLDGLRGADAAGRLARHASTNQPKSNFDGSSERQLLGNHKG